MDICQVEAQVGGSVNIFANVMIKGEIEAVGGASGAPEARARKGGTGSITINETDAVLNYPEKEVVIVENETYKIDAGKISYVELNDIQTMNKVVGDLTYEVLDTEVAEIIELEGKIKGLKLGTTKVKITDVTNNESTYIYVKVVGKTADKIAVGTNFTIGLKQNGTVWSFGLNDKGQLGTGDRENLNKPTEITVLKDIVDISAGNTHGLAVDKNGAVYTWGNGVLTPTKIGGLSNIVKIDVYANTNIALDRAGKVYTWEQGTSNFTLVEANKEMTDITKNMMLSKEGKVYYISEPTIAIPYIESISKISAKTNHYLMLTADGHVYTVGEGTSGELGNNKNIALDDPTLARISEDAWIDDAYEISAGDKASSAVLGNGKLYVWGDNLNKRLGLVDETLTKVNIGTLVEEGTNLDGDTINIENIETVELGTSHSAISDADGFVYTVGLGTYGELGTEENLSKEKFVKIGTTMLDSFPDVITVRVGETKNVVIATANTFNLKIDVISSKDVEAQIGNNRIAELEHINGIDNIKIKNIQDAVPNYRIKGMEIGSTLIEAIDVKTNDKKHIQVRVIPENSEVVPQIEVGKNFTVLLKSNGTVWTTGINNNGELGLGDSVERNVPKQVTTLEKIVEISVGENHTLLLGESGKMYSFGLNNLGQLGTGSTTTMKVPIQITDSNNKPFKNIVKVVAVKNTSFAIDSDGNLYSFGEGYTKKAVKLNIEESVMDVSKLYYLTPNGDVKKLQGGDTVYASERIVSISEGFDHTLFLSESGKAYSIGANVYGQLGNNGTLGSMEDLVEVENLSDVVSIKAGNKYSLAVTSDGKVYTWGINGEYQLGTDTVQESHIPLHNMQLNQIVLIDAGYTHTAGVRDNGTVYTWGTGEHGELGNGQNITKYAEVQTVRKKCHPNKLK